MDPNRPAPPAAFSEALDWQATLFAPRPERRALLALDAPWPLTRRRVRVHRNHAVELTLSVSRPFLEYAGIAPQWLVGDYDDSLAFAGLQGDADVEVLWLDLARFAGRLGPEEIATWLAGRVAVLRSRTTSPILVFDWDGDPAQAPAFTAAFLAATAGQADVRLADRTELRQELGDGYFDPERAGLTGTRTSATGAVATARLLGSRWLPALLAPRLKAVVIDLDNTLYEGVLGEDGIDGVMLTEGHRELQRTLVELRDSGLFLAVLSRNEPADVEALFGERDDFPLRLDRFDAQVIGWEDKSHGLLQVAGDLRIDPSAMLFVDDNAGELIEMLLRVPGVHCLQAHADGASTARALRDFPGLFAFTRSEADTLRSADLRANAAREQTFAAGADLGTYFRELRVQVGVAHNRAQELARAAELSAKTNQFNLASSRLTAAEVHAAARDAQVTTARLEDRLTDSGIIAMLVARARGTTLFVEELCISCRALGRHLEDLMVAHMLVSGPEFPGVSEVTFAFRDSARNGPARRWLEAFAGVAIPDAPEIRHVTVPAEHLREAAVNPDVRIEVLR